MAVEILPCSPSLWTQQYPTEKYACAIIIIYNVNERERWMLRRMKRKEDFYVLFCRFDIERWVKGHFGHTTTTQNNFHSSKKKEARMLGHSRHMENKVKSIFISSSSSLSPTNNFSSFGHIVILLCQPGINKNAVIFNCMDTFFLPEA